MTKSIGWRSILLVVCLSFGGWSASLGQGWYEVFGEDFSEANQVITAHDGNFIVAGEDVGGLETGSPGVLYAYLIKFNALGDRIWQRTYEGKDTEMDIFPTSDGTYLVHRTKEVSIGGTAYDKACFFKINEAGQTLWEIIVQENEPYDSQIQKIIPEENGTFAFIMSVDGSSVKEFGRVNLDGAISDISSFPAFDFPDDLIAKPGGGFYHSTFKNFQYLEIFELDAATNVVSQMAYSEVQGTGIDLHVLPDGDFVFFQIGMAQEEYQTRIDIQTNTISQQLILDPGGAEIEVNQLPLEDGFLLVGVQFNSANGENASLMLRTDLDGNVVWKKVHSYLPGGQFAFWSTQAADKGFVVVGNFESFTSGSIESYVFKTDSLGNVFNNSLSGNVAIDTNNTCLFEQTDIPLEDWAITAKKGTETFFTLSDEDGNFTIALDSGDYQVEVYPITDLWAACDNDVLVSFPANDLQETLNFSINSTAFCPSMTVSQTAPTIRPCFERPSFVNYCNYGSDTAYAAYIDILYDPAITPMSSSLPWEALPNNVYRFQLGDVAPLDCGDFNVNLFLDCEATVGAAYCIETHAYPDTICGVDSSGWSGAFLQVSGSCENDKVNLRIENIGDQDMVDHAGFVIIEDIFLFVLDSTLLDKGNFQDTSFDATGSTFIIRAKQVDGAPGFSNPIAIVEGCQADGSGDFSIGFSNQFPLDDENPFLDVDCPIAVSSFDPNDKTGFPLGYEEQHFIEPETTIEYLIRFQNTGTDTAYTVVIRDTLDANFDIATFRAGASSHDYDVELEGQGILKFSFNNILLPDSIVDEPSSNGFVEFKIAPRNTTPLGTVLKNKAAIYFDFNEPVITNETFHTLGVNYVKVVTGLTYHPTASDVEVLVMPNPFYEEAVLQVIDHQASNYQLEIYTMEGKLIRKRNYNNSRILVERGHLPPGVYPYRLTALDGFLHTGQLVIH